MVSVGPLAKDILPPFEAAGPVHGSVSVGPKPFTLKDRGGEGPRHGKVSVGVRPFTRAGEGGRPVGPDHGKVSVGLPIDPTRKLEDGDGPYGVRKLSRYCDANGSFDGLEGLQDGSRCNAANDPLGEGEEDLALA
jgi:hypothetical protein